MFAIRLGEEAQRGRNIGGLSSTTNLKSATLSSSHVNIYDMVGGLEYKLHREMGLEKLLILVGECL
jgi:hypothetical protein